MAKHPVAAVFRSITLQVALSANADQKFKSPPRSDRGVAEICFSTCSQIRLCPRGADPSTKPKIQYPTNPRNWTQMIVFVRTDSPKGKLLLAKLNSGFPRNSCSFAGDLLHDTAWKSGAKLLFSSLRLFAGRPFANIRHPITVRALVDDILTA